MRKLLLIAIFISTIGFANELEVSTKIIDKISHALIKKDVIKVVVIGEKEKKIVANSILMKSVTECEEADMVLSNGTITCIDKIVFLTSYKVFKKNKQVMGAFFWQKGRPNIIFRKEILAHHKIILPKEFDKYIE